MQDSNWAPKTLVVMFLYCLYVLIDAIYTFFVAFCLCILNIYGRLVRCNVSTDPRYCHTPICTHYFYIIWLPLRKRHYAVVLQWLRCGQGQGLKAKTKATTPKAKATTLKAKTKANILWPQARAKA